MTALEAAGVAATLALVVGWIVVLRWAAVPALALAALCGVIFAALVED